MFCCECMYCASMQRRSLIHMTKSDHTCCGDAFTYV